MSKSIAERVNRTSSVQHEWRLKYGMGGNSPAVQRLGLCTFTAKGPVRSLMGELRSRKPLQHGPKNKTKQNKKNGMGQVELLFFSKWLPVRYTKFSSYFFFCEFLPFHSSGSSISLTNSLKHSLTILVQNNLFIIYNTHLADIKHCLILLIFYVQKKRTSLVAQWLRLWASTAKGEGSIPGRGTMIPACCKVRPKI